MAAMHSMEAVLTTARPVLPVLVLDTPEQGVRVAEALLEGGVRAVEITLRTPAALEVIRQIEQRFPELIIGVGTVLDAEQMQRAQDAGARFAVSPGFTAVLAQAAQALELPWLPGVATASEVMQAQAAGYHCLKLFPGGGDAGLSLLDQFSGPFAGIRFCPSGGIRQEQLADFIARPNVICCGGSWLATAALLANRDWGGITRRAKAAMRILDEPCSNS